ncbi:autotransporter outer membrane beta-barrel domain-containing protein [Xanthomonas sp. CFBP 7698]|nr:putative Ig domain-containing protein [Xanthomonas sp. CFBP 7698]RJS02619.1 autotransporter outer membrane beta-barrel domain-containing protein [Xanthomonas sp. CFBP 7698]
MNKPQWRGTGTGALMRWMVAVMICALALLLPGQVWAQGASAYCSTQNATINQSGSVTFDVSNCDGPSNIGMGDDPRNPLDANGRGSTANGSIQLSFQSGPGTQTVTYTHGGNSATSDTFYLRDEDENVLTFNITINPSRTASIAVSPVNRSEDSGDAFVYTVTLSQTNTSATTVNLARSGTATSGADYSGAVSSVVVPANASSASFSVTPIADSVVEPDETVTFSVANGTGYSPGSPASATATIVNDDVTTASIAVSPTSVAEDGGTNLTYTVTLTQPSATAVSIGFSVGGTATSGTDFAAVNSPLVIPAGLTSGSIVIDPNADATSEPDETVVITLNTGSGYVVGSPNSATGTILNDDVPSLSINDVSVNEGNAGTTTATFTVSLSQPAGAGGVSFDISTADGTANAGSDYVASSLSGQTIPAGSSSATFSVLVNGDSLNEPDETYFVNISNVTGANVADAQGLGTIVNDDTAPALSIDDVSVIEGNSGTTTATFTVSLSTASGQTVTVNYATADGTATAGSDYAARSGTLSFAPGTTTQTVAISVNGDLSVEPNETYRVVLSSATNATIARATGTGTINNDDAVVVIAPASLPAATAGTAYTQNLSASGGTAPYTFALSAGALPAGVTLNASGVLSGTPTASGSFNFTVSATDSGAPTTGSRAYTLVVAGAAVNLPATTLAPGTAGQAYSAAITPASGGIAPYTYTLAAGVLPAGITVNSATGALSGTPTAPGTYNFTLTATDSTSGTPSQGSRSYALTIAAPQIVVAPTTVPGATRGTAYSQALSASGGTAPYTYAIVSGVLPAGLTLASNGTLSGTATVEGTFNFTVQATDANSFTGTQAYALTVAGPNLVLPASTLPAGTAGQAYSAAITPATGGTAPYSYALTAGALPAGVVLDAATGGLSGTPTVAGTFNFTLTASDSTPSPAAQASRSYALSIAAPQVVVAPTTVPGATRGTAYSQALSASGGTAPYTYAIVSGVLPAGLTLASNGTLSGTATVEGTFNFTVQATDANSFTGTQAYALTVAGPNLVLPASTLPTGTAGQAYTAAITPATGGTAPYSYALTAGALPAGVVLDTATGGLSGTPTVAGTFNFTLTASDSTPSPAAQASRSYALTIAAPQIVVAPTTVPGATRGTAYSQALSASGGTAPYTYAIASGVLPAGLTLASNGTLSGTATVEGTFNFTVQATDANSFTGTQAYALTVAGPNLVLPASTLPTGTAGQAYTAAITPATGGTAPYSYALTAGALPAGVVLDTATGGLSGTPTVAGTFNFTLTASDSTPSPAAQASRSYALTIGAATLVIGQGTLPPAVNGTAYSQTLTVSGGVAPYRFSVTSGTLPAGLTLAADGTLSGTPSAEGVSNFTITVTDASAASAAQAYSVSVGSAAPVAMADAAVTMDGTAVTVAVTGNDTGTITAIAITTAPTNGSAVVNGLDVVYTPNAGFIGTDVVSYTASGSGGTSAATTLTITVNARPVAVSVTAEAVPGEAQQVDITRNATGGPFVAAAVVAVLPASAGTATITRVGGPATAAAARASGGPSPAAAAMAETPSFMLTFTPSPAFVGQATVQFTLSNAFATSVPANVVFNIAPRRDPSQDAEVRGLIDAQSESTRRFARAQIDNFQRRLEATHRGGGSFTNAVSFQPTSHCRQAERGITAQPCSPDTQDADNDLRDAPAAAAAGSSEGVQGQGDLGLWIGGAIRSGSLNRQTNSNGVDFQTDGLSVGADYRVAQSLAIGAGLGWGRDDSDVGTRGSRSKGTAYTMALYASFHPGKAFFFDTLVGYQMLSYDLRRFVTDDSSLAEGNRDGKQWIASLSTGADLQRGDVQITPYARVDVARATLDGYAEDGVAPFALRYADMDVATTTGNLGLRLEWRREVRWGRLTPQLRVEYQRDFQGRGDATLSYADLSGGPFYRTAQSAFDRNRLMVGIGAALLTEQGLSTRLEYRGITDGDSNNDQTWMINLEKKY